MDQLAADLAGPAAPEQSALAPQVQEGLIAPMGLKEPWFVVHADGAGRSVTCDLGYSGTPHRLRPS